MQHENNELISILMPAYNAAEFLPLSVQSVLDQSHNRFELIIVDDGSEDETLEIARRLAKEDERIKVFTKQNAGCSAARNYGLKHSNGSLIALLDADDTWHSTFLESMYCALSEHPESCLVYCGWQNLGVSKDRGKPYVPPDYNEGPDKNLSLLNGCPWPIHAALTRRCLIEKAGGFNENLHTAEDYDLWLRIAMGNKIVRVPEVLAYYHHYGHDNATANHALVAIDQHKVQRAYLASNTDALHSLERRRAKALISKQLLYRGFECYWHQDLPAARKIFRHAMRFGHGTLRQWVYMLPSILPYQLHKNILKLTTRQESSGSH